MLLRVYVPLLALILVMPGFVSADSTAGLSSGAVELTSVGPIAFAPDGVLLVSDPMAATIYAIATDDTSGDPSSVELNVEDVRAKMASMLGTAPQDTRIIDLAVNPHSGNVYRRLVNHVVIRPGIDRLFTGTGTIVFGSYEYPRVGANRFVVCLHSNARALWPALASRTVCNPRMLDDPSAFLMQNFRTIECSFQCVLLYSHDFLLTRRY